MLEALENSKLAYNTKIRVQRDEYTSRRELPIIIYVPTPLAPRYIVGVVDVMRSVLEEYYVTRKMFFKPDLFTEKGIYSVRTSHKLYIYVY